jgi:hypothetical protein
LILLFFRVTLKTSFKKLFSGSLGGALRQPQGTCVGLWKHILWGSDIVGDADRRPRPEDPLSITTHIELRKQQLTGSLSFLMIFSIGQ